MVVGGGYTGLAAARELARRGRSVVVVERDRPGRGASGRNAGMVHPGTGHGLATLLGSGGGRALWAECVTAFEELAGLVEREGLDCAWERSGHVELALHPRAVDGLRRDAEAHARLGEAVALLEGDALRAEIGSDAFAAGLLVRRSGAVHPAALARALLALATGDGVRVCTGIAARRLRRRGERTVVETDVGDIVARDVVLATGATTGGLAPRVARRILSVGSYVVATEEIPADLAASVSPRGRMFFDTRNFLNYWRLSPDRRRVLFGGRTSFAPTTLEQARDALHRSMVQVHPQLAGARVERVWSGTVDLTLDRMPHVGRDPATGAAYALGYSGTGVALSTYLGAVLARWLCGEAGLPAFGRHRMHRVPVALRAPGALPALGAWYRVRDALGR